MADQDMPRHLEVMGRQVVECARLRFEATFRAPAGATLRAFGDIDGHVTEVLRFDDFIDGPHYHIPAAGDPRPFDQAALGEPLTWIVSQLRDHLPELLAEAGFCRTSTSMRSLTTQRTLGKRWKPACPTGTYEYRGRFATIPCLILE